MISNATKITIIFNYCEWNLSFLLYFFKLIAIKPAIFALFKITFNPKFRSNFFTIFAKLLALLIKWSQSCSIIIAISAHQEANTIFVKCLDLVFAEETTQSLDVNHILWPKTFSTLTALVSFISVYMSLF